MQVMPSSSTLRWQRYQQRKRAGNSQAAAYQRAYRARAKNGRAIFPVEAEIGLLGDLLKANGYLHGDWDLENSKEIRRALQKFVDDMTYARANGIKFYVL